MSSDTMRRAFIDATLPVVMSNTWVQPSTRSCSAINRSLSMTYQGVLMKVDIIE